MIKGRLAATDTEESEMCGGGLVVTRSVDVMESVSIESCCEERKRHPEGIDSLAGCLSISVLNWTTQIMQVTKILEVESCSISYNDYILRIIIHDT